MASWWRRFWRNVQGNNEIEFAAFGCVRRIAGYLPPLGPVQSADPMARRFLRRSLQVVSSLFTWLARRSRRRPSSGSGVLAERMARRLIVCIKLLMAALSRVALPYLEGAARRRTRDLATLTFGLFGSAEVATGFGIAPSEETKRMWRLICSRQDLGAIRRRRLLGDQARARCAVNAASAADTTTDCSRHPFVR